jgi:LPXTG-site transpeptidase (sortase) family protein
MPGGIRNTAGGIVRSSVAVGVATLLALAAFVVQAPELVLAAAQGCVTPGSAGPNATLTGIVNSYYPATASAASGATAIALGASLPAGATPIAAGDLLLVIQIQDADIQGTNAITYGDGATGRGSTGLRSTGLYEYVSATSAVPVGGGTVNIAGTGGGGGLVNSYDFSAAVTATHGLRTFQVIRVPQYASATVAAGLTAAAWDGAAHAGGILAIDVAGALNLNSQTISVNQLGFKGGLGVIQAGPLNGNTGTDYVVPSQNGAHGYKAEGIAGTPRFLYDAMAAAAVNGAADGYPVGDAARGAPGNAGGGGTDADPVINDENSGGGGGANGGQGGTGGNSWNSNLPVGGLGGAAFLPTAAKVVLGGGGGAGTRNNSPTIPFASSGGTGGGIVVIRAGLLTGAGTITANGAVGVTPENDGGGGGGAGGSVVITATTGTFGGLTIHADGGNGTDAWPTGTAGTANRHGPGGGGGGGVIVTSNVPLAQTVLGGAHGITTNGAADAYGSTDGSAGLTLTTTAGAIPGSSSGAECLPVLTVAKSTSTPNVTNTVTGTVATYSISVSNAANTAAATSVSISDALPVGFSYASTGGVALSGGATRPTTVNPSPGDTSPAFGTFSIPGGGSVVITFTVNIASSVTPGTYDNPAAATYLDPARVTALGTTSSAYPGGGAERVSVGLPDMTIAKSHADPFVRGSTTATYTLTATNSGGGASTGTVTVTDTLPAGLTPTAIAGSGWTCPAPVGQTVSCTRADAIAAGASYPPIRVTVTILLTAPSTVTNVATVSGGGESNSANDTASDPSNIISLAGLPNTSGLQVGAGAPGTVAPGTMSGGWVIALGLIAGVAGFAVAIIGRRGRHVRFRPRRRRPAASTPALIGVVVCALAVGQFVPDHNTGLMSPSATVVGAAPGGGEVGNRTELVGTTVVTISKPAAPVETSFYAAAGPIAPSRLRIPSIGVDAPVAGVSLLQDGSMAVPNNLWTSGWLSSSARPGQAGSAVIAGHRGIGTQALFSHLENVRPGDKVHVSDAGGGELVYEVTRVASMDLSVATQLQVFGPTTQQQLVLITCFGQYSRSTRTYDHRLVVFSSLLPPP